jgi:hypothetical protein
MPTLRANMRKDRRELRIVTSACLLAAFANPLHAPESTAATLKRSTQALLDAVAPGKRAVWEHYSDPAFTYVTEDNEVKTAPRCSRTSSPSPRLDRVAPGRPRTRRIFTRAPDGRVSGFADRREGTDLVWTRLAPQGAR